MKIQNITDVAENARKMKSEQEKNWRYYQRFHFHATGIGAMMMGILLLLGGLKAPKDKVTIASYTVDFFILCLVICRDVRT